MEQGRFEDACKNENIKVKYSWVMQVLLVLDQFGNVLAGGNSDITISGRVGYNVHVPAGEGGAFWKKMERIINYSFYPLDGPHHCLLAYCSDKDEEYRGANLFFRFVLGILVFVFCLLLFIPIRLIALIKSLRTHYILPTGEEIPYRVLEHMMNPVVKTDNPCEILKNLTKRH